MREIKFRAKDLKKNWLYGYYVQHGGTSFIVDANGVSHIVNEDTLGQFTGVIDLNGKEIYEGDIIKASQSTDDCKEPVLWYDEESGFGGFPDAHIIEEDGSATLDDYVILGNIHDNPEHSVQRALELQNPTAGPCYENAVLRNLREIAREYEIINQLN